MTLDNFSNQADLYARYRPGYPQDLYDFILKHVKARQRAWDCATGTGKVAVVLADHFDKVEASDISSQQMNHAPGKPNIRYTVQAAEKTKYPNDYFDLITVAQAIHWFDFDKFYNEMRRIAKPNALLAVIGYGMVSVNETLDPVITRFYEYAFGSHFMQNRKYLDDHYITIPFPFDEIDSPAFSISYKWSRDQLEGYFDSWSAVQQIKEEEDINPVDKVVERLKPEWPKKRLKKVTFPVFLRLGRIQK